MMDRIIVTAADIEKLLAWRDEHKELVRSMPVPLREVKIQVVENGISIKCFRSDKKLKFYLDSPSQKLPRRKWPVNAGEIPSMTRRQKRMLTDSEESLFGEPLSSTLTSHIGRMQFFILWTFRSGCRCPSRRRKNEHGHRKNARISHPYCR